MIFEQNNDQMLFFMVWSFINRWVGVVVSAVAFCLLDPNFLKLLSAYILPINIALFVVAASCVLEEMTKLIAISIYEKLIKQKIKEDILKMEGGSIS